MNWKPRRFGPHGFYYCSPACGGNCTWAAYQRAKKNAERLAKLLGGGFKPEVSENLGWHWSASKGGHYVSGDGINISPGFGGKWGRSWTAFHNGDAFTRTTPRKAVTAARDALIVERMRLKQLLVKFAGLKL